MRQALALFFIVAVPVVVLAAAPRPPVSEMLLAQPVVPGCPNPAASCSRANFSLVDGGQLYIANNATIAKTLRAASVDAGELNVANNAQVAGNLLVTYIDAGEINSPTQLCVNNCSSRILESSGDVYLQAVATGGYMRCGNNNCFSNVRTSLPILDAGQLFVANDTTLTGAIRSGSTTNRGSCTLDGASPSKCTATVNANANCVCSGKGTTAAAAVGCATSVSSTTLTCTAANGLTSDVSYVCF